MTSTIQKHSNRGVIAAGVALFSMFFGAGDLLWPLILGGESGNLYIFGMLGLIITGVSLPLIGLMAMMLFEGNYKTFFGQLGTLGGLICLCIVQGILGPVGSLPRLITLTYVTLKPYFIWEISLPIFSVLAGIFCFFFAIYPKKIVTILGNALSPMLLICLGVLLGCGLYHPPPPEMIYSSSSIFLRGINVGYSTLDLIASFIYAPIILRYFTMEEGMDRTTLFSKMKKASLLAALLLAGCYIGLVTLAAHYTPILPPHAPEERLMAIAHYLLGNVGGLFTCVIVALSCLTTAIPITIAVSKSLQEDILRNKISYPAALILVLLLSMSIATLGFMGIARMLMPVLQIICPTLIVMAIHGIAQKVRGVQPLPKKPLFAVFLLTLVGYFFLHRG